MLSISNSAQLGFALAYVFLPLYLRLGLTSTFEYLERRFNRRIRLLASIVFTVKSMLFIPVVIYVPALAFSQGRRYLFQFKSINIFLPKKAMQ